MKVLPLGVIFLGLLSAPPAGFAEEYVAYSLKVARERIQSVVQDQDFRQLHPTVFHLAGIRELRGLVVDRTSQDVILVGKKGENRSPLTLDDFVVALRSRLVRAEWPAVSIDPPESPASRRIHSVRFEGGIDNTRFGQDLLDADYELKKMVLGYVSPGIESMKTYWDLRVDQLENGRPSSVVTSGRIWFFPIVPIVPTRRNVAAFKGCKVGVYAQILSATKNGEQVKDVESVRDAAMDEFVRLLREHYEEMTDMHPSFRRVQQLTEVAALARAIEVMEDNPDLSWWLDTYRVQETPIRKNIEEVTRSQPVVLPDGSRTTYTLAGGAKLWAIARRLKAGDITALNDAVRTTRPRPDALAWTFVVGDWVLPIPAELAIREPEKIMPLLFRVAFLNSQKRYEEILEPLDKVLQISPNLIDMWMYKGDVMLQLRRYSEAIECSNRVLIGTPDAHAYYNRGVAQSRTRRLNNAVSDYTEAIRLKPTCAEAYCARGIAHFKQKRVDSASRDLAEAIRLDPALAEAYIARGEMYAETGDLDQAMREFDTAISVQPNCASAYNNRGVVYWRRRDANRAIVEFTKAIQKDATLADAYDNRGLVLGTIGELDKAIVDFQQAIHFDPQLADAYGNRGVAFRKKGLLREAVADYTKAISCDPNNQNTYFKRGEAYQAMRSFANALDDYQRANVPLVVEVVSPRAAIRVGSRSAGEVPLGEKLNVTRVNGDWLWVRREGDSTGDREAWIHQKDVK